MEIHLSGKVISEMKKGKMGGRYRILSGDDEYEVIVYGKQVFKDYLFVRKNQQVEIDGILEAKKIFLRKAKICLQKAQNPTLAENEGEYRNENGEGIGEGSKKLQGRKPGEF